jgi:hypothetical protein
LLSRDKLKRWDREVVFLGNWKCKDNMKKEYRVRRINMNRSNLVDMEKRIKKFEDWIQELLEEK